MIGYRGEESILSEEKFKDYIVSVEGVYIRPTFSYEAYEAFKKYDNTPELYSDLYIGDYVTSAFAAMRDCHNFNHMVYIGNHVRDISYLLTRCYSFNRDLIIPNSIVACTSTLSDCSNFNSHVFFNHKNESVNEYFASNMFRNIPLNKYIHATREFAPVLKNRWLVHYNEILNWTNLSDNNGWYNSQYNVFLYNNYVI